MLPTRREASRSVEQMWPFVFMSVAKSLKSGVLSMFWTRIVSQLDELRLHVARRSRTALAGGGGGG